MSSEFNGRKLQLITKRFRIRFSPWKFCDTFSLFILTFILDLWISLIKKISSLSLPLVTPLSSLFIFLFLNHDLSFYIFSVLRFRHKFNHTQTGPPNLILPSSSKKTQKINHNNKLQFLPKLTSRLDLFVPKKFRLLGGYTQLSYKPKFIL